MYCTENEKVLWDNTIDILTTDDQGAIDEHFSNMDSETNKIIMRLAVKLNVTPVIHRLLVNGTRHIIFGCRVAARYNYPMLKTLLLSDINRTNKRIVKIKSNIAKHRLFTTILNDDDV